jgi:hypothetical protein
MSWNRSLAAIVLLLAACFTSSVIAQERAEVLAGAELTRVVPPGFYYQGLSAPTQLRNSAAARFDTKRYVVVGMVDTSGYAADIRAKYEGFFITDSAITINGTTLAVGAYGFGFSNDNKLTIVDLSGNDVLSVSTTTDKQLKRPRPLMMMKSGNSIRLYSGRQYAVIAAQ